MIKESRRVPMMGWAVIAVIGIAYAIPLFSLFRFAADTTLFSYILGVPFCSAYLVHLQRTSLPREYASSPIWALGFCLMGVAALAGASRIGQALDPGVQVDLLALQTCSFLCFLAAAGFFFLGRTWMAAAAGPILFLCFMIPLPPRAQAWLEVALQAASTEAAALLFRVTGTPFVREEAVFHLPAYSLQVAQECSGIQATWILFVSTVLASYLFLKSPWRRAIFVLCVIPLGILRNGFRIVTIGLLCIHVGPHMIDSDIHRKGGPLFLGLSLIPYSIFLWWLCRGEAASRKAHPDGETEHR
jgi:exosortase C (VPDSG-CTERM-specific)